MEKNKLAMVLFILSESTFFALLILAYAYFRTVPDSGPTPQSSLSPLVTGVFSLFLFFSSFTVWLAGRRLRQQKAKEMAIWLLVTVILGTVFLVGQGIEWAKLISEGTTVSRNLFGTTFFTLTGFHGAHVAVGLVMLGTLFGFAQARAFRGRESSALESISLYWHFVDGVWVLIFSLVYLTIVV